MASRRALAAEPEGPGEDHTAVPRAEGAQLTGGDVTPVRLNPIPLAVEVRPVTPLRQGETYHQRLDAFGVDEVGELITGGNYLSQVAEAADVTPGSLLQWIAKDPERNRTIAEARRMSAQLFDEQGVHVVRNASSWFQLEQAKQLAQHFRWRASKIDVQGYGEKQSIDMHVKPLPMEEVDAKLKELAGFWAQVAPTQPALQLPRHAMEDVTDVDDISGLDEVLR